MLDSVGITFFDAKVMQANIALEKAIMTHRNPYRGNKTYGEDPAVAQIEVTNEDGVFFYTIDGIAPYYAKRARPAVGRLAAQQVRLAREAGRRLGRRPQGRRAAGRRHRQAPEHLELQQGASRSRPPRAGDQLRFYFELNNGYFQKTKDALRAAGVRQPICGTGWFGVGAGFYPELYSNVPGMDYIDRHHYYGGGPGGWQILPGMPFNHEAALTEPKHILKLGMERVLGMPYGISEWANVLPNQWRLEAPPIMTFYGQCLNGWDVPIHFALDGRRGGFCQFPQVDVAGQRALDALPISGAGPGDPPRRRPRRAELVFARNLSEEKTFSAQPLKDVAIKVDISGPYEMSAEQGINARSLASYYAAAVGKTGVQFQQGRRARFLHRPGPIPRHAEEGDPLGRRASCTGTTAGAIVTANTPRMQAAVGFLAGVPVKLADCQISTFQPLRFDPGGKLGRQAAEGEQAHPDHRRGTFAEHRHGLQPRRPAADRHRQAARAPGRRARDGPPGPQRAVHRHGPFALRVQDGRRSCRRSRAARIDRAVGRPQQSGLLRRAVPLSDAARIT